MEERPVARDQAGERVDVGDHGVDRPGRHASVPEGALCLELDLNSERPILAVSGAQVIDFAGLGFRRQKCVMLNSDA
jgi:hypothetical protein